MLSEAGAMWILSAVGIASAASALLSSTPASVRLSCVMPVAVLVFVVGVSRWSCPSQSRLVALTLLSCSCAQHPHGPGRVVFFSPR